MKIYNFGNMINRANLIRYFNEGCNLNLLSNYLIRNQLSTTSKCCIKSPENTQRRIEPIDDEEFPVLVIPGHTQLPREDRRIDKKRKPIPPPRYKSMRTDQVWTDVWPTAQTFKWSAIPFPVRQGLALRDENDGISPAKYANAELMKIPNFLHLTPPHIKKHCAAIKDFCTPWPKGLETDEDCEKHFPVDVKTSDYVLDGPSIRDPRARVITLKVKLSQLQLDDHARDKFIRLAAEKYDPITDIVTLETDRCPLKKQNYDHAVYLLTALYHESWKTEDWEKEKTLDDWEKYVWDIMPSKQAVLKTLSFGQKEKGPGLSESEDDLLNRSEVQDYKEALTQLHNEGEDLQTLDAYKKAAINLLLRNSGSHAS